MDGLSGRLDCGRVDRQVLWYATAPENTAVAEVEWSLALHPTADSEAARIALTLVNALLWKCCQWHRTRINLAYWVEFGQGIRYFNTNTIYSERWIISSKMFANFALRSGFD